MCLEPAQAKQLEVALNALQDAASDGPDGDGNQPRPTRQSSRGSASGIDEVDLRDVSRQNLDQTANLKGVHPDFGHLTQ